MSLEFWLISAALLVLATAIVTIPLFKKSALLTVTGEQRNLGIARQQLSELQQQLQEGSLSQAQFDAQYQELQLNLSSELATKAPVVPGNATGRWVIPLVLVFVPLLSVSLYLQWGEPDAEQKVAEQQENDTQLANVRKLIPQLIERLKQNPEDLEGWLLLGRSYLYAQNYPAAKDVFAKLYQFKPDDVDVMLNYANTLAMNNNGQLAGEAEVLIFKALAKAPDNNNALWLAGMAKAEQGEDQQAAHYWQKLLTQLPANSEGSLQVQQLLAELQKQDNQTVSASEAAISTRIQVQVAIDATKKGNLPAQTTVFIYAQALNGPKMPLAIVRKTLADLPVSVELNNTMGMTPNLHLTDFKQLKIVARVSPSGDAISHAGDLIGSVEINELKSEQSLSVLINQVVP
jgi:cytochrome c-type biogenesis protein CcmH